MALLGWIVGWSLRHRPVVIIAVFLFTLLGLPPRDWRAGLEACLDQLMTNTPPDAGPGGAASAAPAAGPAARKDQQA